MVLCFLRRTLFLHCPPTTANPCYSSSSSSSIGHKKAVLNGFETPSADDERSLYEEIPHKEPKIVHEIAGRKKTNCSVHGAGLTTSGALVIPFYKSQNGLQSLVKPMRIDKMNVKNIKMVAAGCGFSLFASPTELYGSGLNNFYQISGPRRIIGDRETPDPNSADMWYLEGRRIMLPEGSGRIQCISAGRMHSVVLTDKNKVFCFGSNTHGQCAVNPSEMPEFTHNKHHMLHAVKNLPLGEGENDKIVKVHACLDTTFALCQDGRLFAWGLGTDGQLGNGSEQFQWQPELVGGDLTGERVQHIGGSTDTLLAVNDKGDLFVWGQNEYGQMGAITDEPQIFLPQFVPFKMGKVVDAQATGCSCIVCNSEGAAFAWGSHILGFGPKVERLDRPMQLDPPLFASALNDDSRVKRVFAGNTSMGALTEAGYLFTWGANRHGNLALGHRNHQYFPFQVTFTESLREASLGPDHSLFITNKI